jgi:hypothetical protein
MPKCSFSYTDITLNGICTSSLYLAKPDEREIYERNIPQFLVKKP